MGADDAYAVVASQLNPGSGWFHLERRTEESCSAYHLSTACALPDPAICRAKDAGLDDYADCLVEHPGQCRHALGFGWGFLCRHPQRNEIVLRTSTYGQ